MQDKSFLTSARIKAAATIAQFLGAALLVTGMILGLVLAPAAVLILSGVALIVGAFFYAGEDDPSGDR